MSRRAKVHSYFVRIVAAHGSRASIKKEIDFAIARLKFDAWSVVLCEDGEPVRAPARRKVRR